MLGIHHRNEQRPGPEEDPRRSVWYAGSCPNCRAACMMVNGSWAECISPYCKKPYSIMGIWVEDYYDV